MLAILVVLPLLAEDLVAQLFSHPRDGTLEVIKQPTIEADQVVRCFVFVSDQEKRRILYSVRGAGGVIIAALTLQQKRCEFGI